MTRVADLPDDPALLKRMLAERDVAITEHDALIERIKTEAAEQLEALRLRLEAEKKAEIDAILRRFYGPKSERFDPRQLLLFGVHVDAMPLDEPSIEDESGEQLVTRRVRNRHKHGRQQLPDHLPRIEIEHDLADDQKPCPCCGEVRHRNGQEISEQLDTCPRRSRCSATSATPRPASVARPRRSIPGSRRPPSRRRRSTRGWLGRGCWPT